ncbi:hypothetical protein MMF93_12740 [Streptomyces tubbatahanensis]|uniref:Lipoprotein n=1 Tax=Streptomyces tubbatahanensis TaxID=2923272 RepID=A0ABY3XS86_9ACTN|nr:hypothetical protein [Streptomyces tubbatahanensis]UNS97275.1 hypothetical protein MMF93_12740 [Streptomyces tubbatahanensis]
MQLNRPAASLAAAAVASALLLSGCGGGGEGSSKDGKIEGAGSSKDDTSPSPSGDDDSAKDKPADFRTSDIELPEDVDLVFDWKQPSDPEKAAALDGAADYMRAMMHAMAEQKPNDPTLVNRTVPLGSAQEYATSLVKVTSKKGYTVTGKERYYKEKVGDIAKGKLVEVDYCANQAEIFSKVAKTGKVIKDSPSDKSYLHFELVMQKSSNTGEPWKAKTADVIEGAVKQCAG